ncbi:hypothetical protein BST92_03530 [Nonlabens arenilitoris]|uniref:DUF3667 domain-containing protein n=1 Tax=Nonlabens arenilitoris TaxID=1217969 RepID=A0A2S7U9W5_9FLAO|nr:DUF3667 domain-containing protein [Nonlabens arenilitoris]PQJ31052.1 hypothetical protein BST92_03530 [Nonlabens arenilitoris]
MKPTVRSLAKYRGNQCLNCQTPLDIADKYCHQCGQLNTTKRLALKDFFTEFFANFIAYDSRVWRTITHILIKPGYVTEQYCNGKRTEYANPFRFFLTVSIVFFLLLQLAIQFSDTSHLKSQKSNNSGIFNVSIDSTTQNKAELIELIKNQQDSLGDNQNFYQKLAIDRAIEEIEKDTTTLNIGRTYYTQEKLDNQSYFSKYFSQVTDYTNFYGNHPSKSTSEALNELGHRLDNQNITRYNKAKKFSNLTDQPVEMINIILPKVPLFLFFFAPFMSLFFWLIYARGRWNYMEHMVFNFHLLTFVFLILYLIIAEKSFTGTSIIAALFFGIIGPLYLYKSMRKFYKQGRFKTILKFLFINFVFFVLLLVSSTLFMLGSIFLSI